MKYLLLVSLILSNATFASANQSKEPVIRLSIEEVTSEGYFKSRRSYYYDEEEENRKPTVGEHAETAGQIISAAKEMVALGEAIYELVNKGKPKTKTEYAPISVVPRDPSTKEPVDVFELEGFSMPVERTFVAKITADGKTVVNFTYKVMYSYGGSFNGSGKYLANVNIIPSTVTTAFGWEFNATMKLSGMMNHGTKANPIAGIMVTMQYKVDSWTSSHERNDTIHIMGSGELKNYMVNR